MSGTVLTLFIVVGSKGSVLASKGTVNNFGSVCGLRNSRQDGPLCGSVSTNDLKTSESNVYSCDKTRE